MATVANLDNFHPGETAENAGWQTQAIQKSRDKHADSSVAFEEILSSGIKSFHDRREFEYQISVPNA